MTLALWWMVRGAFVELLALLAERIFRLVENPPLITSLDAAGDTIAIRSFLTGLDRVMATWSAWPLHAFVVACLALVFAAPVGKAGVRARVVILSLSFISAVSLAICLVQLELSVDRYAADYLGIEVHTAGERRLLGVANTGLIMVGGILFPALLFLLSYLSSWGGPGERKPARRRSAAGAGLLAGAGIAFAALIATLALHSGLEADPRAYHEGWRKILDLNPGYPPALVNYGLHLEEQGQPGEAVQLFRRALERDPDLVEAHYDLGVALYRMERYEEAVASFEAALERRPGHPHAHRNLGLALAQLQRNCDALRHLELSRRFDIALFQDEMLKGQIELLRPLCGE